MASIMKRGNTYSVRYNYKDHNGKPCKGWETFKTKAEAQERKITVEKELLDGTFLVPDAMTVEEMLYKWIPIQSSKHKWSPKTYTQSVAMVQNLIVPYIGKRKVRPPHLRHRAVLRHAEPDPMRSVRSRREAGAYGKPEEAAAVQHVHSRSPHTPEDRLFVCC